MNYRMSYWEKTELYQNMDIAVIGSGIIGLLSAIALQKQHPEQQVYILERGSTPIGASTRNAGFACLGSPSEIVADIEKNGFQASIDLIQMRWEGLIKLREILSDEDLDFSMDGGHELFTEYDEQVYRNCEEILPQLNNELRRITGIDQCYTPKHEAIKQFRLGGAERLINIKAEGQLNPGKMTAKLMKLAESLGIKIMNGISIEKIEDTGSCRVAYLIWLELVPQKVDRLHQRFYRELNSRHSSQAST
jgi:gamma-glutamylputrescine oxidase